MARILPALQQSLHRVGGFLYRRIRVRPMHLIDVDEVGAQAAQRILDFVVDAGAAGVAERLAVLPVEPDFRRDNGAVTPAAFGERLADDFLGLAESVDRRGIDQRDATIQRRTDRADRLSSSVPPHIQPPIAQVPGRCVSGRFPRWAWFPSVLLSSSFSPFEWPGQTISLRT